MAIRENFIKDAPLSALAADIHTDPVMRAAWLEVAAARMAAQLMRTARKECGLSQEEVARALNISQARVSQVESGRVEDIPSLELLARFLDACGDGLLLSSTNTRAAADQAEPVRAERMTTLRSGRLSRHEAYAVSKPAFPDEAEAEAVIPRQDYAKE